MTEQNDKISEQTEDAVVVSTAAAAAAAESTEPAERTQSLQQAAPPAEPDSSYEQRAMRRGCFSIIFGAVLGAMVGAALTLAVLSWLNNGTLSYNQTSLQLRNQLDDEIATREFFLEAQATTMNNLVTRQANAESTMAYAVNEVEAGMATAEAEVAKMQVTAVYLETRIGQAGNAADTLDAFLGGLDDLLSHVEPTATPTPMDTP